LNGEKCEVLRDLQETSVRLARLEHKCADIIIKLAEDPSNYTMKDLAEEIKALRKKVVHLKNK
jgi:polyhydroxyalkanoate synthesis regulator phasin